MIDLKGLDGRDCILSEWTGVVMKVELGNSSSQVQRQEYRASSVDRTLGIYHVVNSVFPGTLGSCESAALRSSSIPGISQRMSSSRSDDVFDSRPRLAHGMVFHEGSSRKHRLRSTIYPIAFLELSISSKRSKYVPLTMEDLIVGKRANPIPDW